MAEEGIVLTRQGKDRVDAAVRWVERNLMTRPPEQGPRGPAQAEVGWALTTTGTADGNGHYSADISVPKVDGSGWDEYTGIKLKPITGTLANATRYAARPAGTAPGGEELWVVVGDGAGSSSSLTVQEADGSPSVTAVTTITVAQGQGLRVTGTTVTAAMTIDDASLTQVGVVSLGSQSFNGKKFFDDGIVLSPASFATAIQVQNGGTGTAATSNYGFHYFYVSAGIPFYVTGVTYDSNHGTSITFRSDTTFSQFSIDATRGGVAVRPDILISTGTGSKTGETGTFLGMEFTSGLLTNDNGVGGGAPISGPGGGLTTGTVTVASGTGAVADSGITDDGTTTGFTRAVALDTTHISGGAVLADIDNQDPSGSSVLFFDLSSASISLTGVQGGTDGRIVKLFNTSGSKNLTLKHDTTSSTAANRFYTPGAADYVIGPYGSAEIVYNGTQSRWLVMDKA